MSTPSRRVKKLHRRDIRHAHVYGAPEIRTDIAPRPLVERFGARWWFQVCEVCGAVNLAPAQAPHDLTPPPGQVEWILWRSYIGDSRAWAEDEDGH